MKNASSGPPVPDHPFDAPWHAAAFAITVHLHAQGMFSWQDWAATLGSALAGDARAGALDGSDDYYHAWLVALQEMLAARGVTAMPEIERVMQDWQAAYLATPHGQPVTLGTTT